MISLHMKSKVITLHHKMEVLDDSDNVVYDISSKMLSIHDKTYITNAQGKEVAYMTRKVISLHETHTVEMANGQTFEVRSEWFHLIKDVIDIPELGWQLKGDFMRHNYQMFDAQGNLLASTHMKWFSIHQVCTIDIEDESQMDTIVALFVTLEHIIQDRIAAESDGDAARINNNNNANNNQTNN